MTEPGFNWLVRLVYGVCGGEYYEVVFALFALFTLVLFLKVMYEQSEDFAFAFFLFMTLGLYFQTYNTVRYYLVLAMALYSIRFCLQRDWIKSVSYTHLDVYKRQLYVLLGLQGRITQGIEYEKNF